ncbi:eukaryotic mitochondrial regulator protein-domain-containing protein [Choanephora cucurbitarum]|nr:eukaryotic mitochondrial regulator protein-domain-containing protein [Choanephora cucurbitarum]
MQSSRLLNPVTSLFRTIVSKRFVAAPVLNNQKFFSFSAQQRDEEPTKTPEAAVEEEPEPVKLSRRRRRFHEWANGPGSKFARPAKGTTNYLSVTPFPNNPLFQPRPPLSDARRQEIYDAFVTDPENWTVRKLATKYGISLKRVEAILKLKSLEKEMEMNGVALQKKFNKGMEQLMGVDKTAEILREPLADVFPPVGKPKFKTLKEDAPFTPQDAAKELNRIPFKDLERLVIESEQAEFTLPTPSTTEPSSEKQAKKRTKLVIVDTSA